MARSGAVSMIVANAVFMVLAVLSVALRFFIRQKQRTIKLSADDWLILVALFFAIALGVTNIVGVPVGGFGFPFTSLSEEKAETFLKILFVLQFWYLIAVAFVKLSLLCLYGRIFSTRRFPWVINILLGITVAWLISFLFATFFQVWPIRCNWIACDPTTNYTVMYTCSSVSDIILDIIILCLPAGFIRKLKLSSAQKRGLLAVFGLGIFCIVASIARLVYAVRYVEVNITGNYAINFDGAVVNMIMWSGIEACTSVVCSNLPCYAPLLRSRSRSHSSPSYTSNSGSRFFSTLRTVTRNPFSSIFSSHKLSHPSASLSGKAQFERTTSEDSIIGGEHRGQPRQDTYPNHTTANPYDAHTHNTYNPYNLYNPHGTRSGDTSTRISIQGGVFDLEAARAHGHGHGHHASRSGGRYHGDRGGGMGGIKVDTEMEMSSTHVGTEPT